MAATCGPYKKISGQICSILPWLLEACVPQGCLGCCWLDSGARTLAACAAGWQIPVAPYKKISDQICSILPWLLEA